MPDREKMIQALENADALSGIIKMTVEVRDILVSLLKEQETAKGHWIVLEFCANEGIYCSECHMKIFDRTTKPKKKLSQYCPHCGSRNEQFFRDGEVVFR